MTWSAKQYTMFEQQRTRPVRDLVAAIPTVGPTEGDKFFAAKAGHAIATVSGMYRNNGFVYKAHDWLLARWGLLH